MEGYYWATIALSVFGLCGIGAVCFLLNRVLRGIECMKGIARLIVNGIGDFDRHEMSRHAETAVILEKLRFDAQKPEELTEEERELQRKQEQAFSDGVSNILNYGVDKR